MCFICKEQTIDAARLVSCACRMDHGNANEVFYLTFDNRQQNSYMFLCQIDKTKEQNSHLELRMYSLPYH